MYCRSLPFQLLFWRLLLLLRFVVGDPSTSPDIICSQSHLPSDFNLKDCEHILSTFPALHLDPGKQIPTSPRPILSLPLRAPPYCIPARFTYKTCRVEYAAFGMFQRPSSIRQSDDSDHSSHEFLGHVHRRGQTVSRPRGPLTEEQKAFYLWPEAKEVGAAVMKKCLAERGALGEARGRFHVPEKGTATRARYFSTPITTYRTIYYNIKLEPSSNTVDKEYLWPHHFSRLNGGYCYGYNLSPDVFHTPPSSPSHGQSSTSPFDSAHR